MYEKIQQLCEAKGISIHRMCADLAINDSVISNLKNRTGQTSLSAENTAKIADYFNISALELIGKVKA